MAITSPQQLMAVKLQQIEDAETEATRCIQEIQQHVRNPQVKQLLDQRLQEGQMVMQGIREALPRLGTGQAAGATTQNKAARGIIEEARTFLNEVQSPELKEAVAIGGVQSLEHYCIATWGTVKALAREMGDQQLVQVMEKALDSGKRLDSQLSDLAEGRVNPAAMQQSGQSGMGSQTRM
jgi:ferritin-like metal-binding protein YciE